MSNNQKSVTFLIKFNENIILINAIQENNNAILNFFFFFFIVCRINNLFKGFHRFNLESNKLRVFDNFPNIKGEIGNWL